ncbi:NUDIX domain-containing protein [Pontibacillus salipaludis]|uniref:NUDIX domain-containing protein n=1 Tax=Pontibacillus salipaludis TaxID=1697394 RepID=UPI0031EFB0AB
MFYKEYREEGEHERHLPIRHRKAVRGVIWDAGKILLVYTNQGIYTFPGGGVEAGESDEEGVIREVAEETGYVNCLVHEKIGEVVESNTDHKNPGMVFEMISHYYNCELKNNDQIPLQLEGYERAEEYDPRWVTLEEAIEQNEAARGYGEARWLRRETYVLRELQKQLQQEGSR